MTKLMLWDVECEKCKHIWEDWAEGQVAPCCPNCNSAFTHLLPGATRPQHKAKNPYDYLK